MQTFLNVGVNMAKDAVMSAAKTKVWRPVYEHYRTKGWSTKATRVIITKK